MTIGLRGYAQRVRGEHGMFQKDCESIFVSVSCRSSVPSGLMKIAKMMKFQRRFRVLLNVRNDYWISEDTFIHTQ